MISESRPWRATDWAALVVVVAVAASLRCWYVSAAADGGKGAAALEVAGQTARPNLPVDVPKRGHKRPTELDNLVRNLEEEHWFGSLAPLADKEEKTAHVSPAYPWLMSLPARFDLPVDALMRWSQAGLGTVTAACYFFFARRAFHSLLAGFLAGLLCSIHPFWIVNTADLG